MDLRETLTFYRKRQNLSQAELAEALNVSRQTISKWETGSALPSAENLLALSKLYSVPADALLNGALFEDIPPEAASLPSGPPAAPPAPKPAAPHRLRLVLQILAAVFVCDVVSFLLDVSMYSSGRDAGFLYFGQIFRLLSCCTVGLFFAWRDRLSPIGRKASCLIAAAALILALYSLLLPVPILWKLYDFIVWTGLHTPDALFPYNPIRTLIGWTLFNEFAFTCHMALIAVFQLTRLRFSQKKRAPVSQPWPVN